MRRNLSNDHQGPLSSRRDFLKLVTSVGAGLTLALNLPVALAADTTNAATEAGVFAPNAFVRIGTDNSVTVIMKHLEMGQGSFTGLATLVAEELDADWSQLRSEGAPADASRYNNLSWGPVQGTGGSSAMANSFMQMRTAGATARAMLVAAAAKLWKVPAAEIQVSQGILSHVASGKSAGFGELAELAALQAIPDPQSLRLKDPADFSYIGQKLPRLDRGKTDGSARFTQDIQLDGMLTALVAHPPRFGGKVSRFDASKALASPGVVEVVQIPNGIAVLAKDFWSAKKGRDLLSIEWDQSAAFTGSRDDMLRKYRALAEQPGLVARADGDATAALANATTLIEAVFEVPYLAHAPMEPMNAVALVNDQGCEMWNGEQFQTIDQSAVASALGLKPEQVKINMLFAGGSFGRRANPHSDYLIEAALIAQAKRGTPVKLVWTREDDTRAGYYRPMYVHKVRAGLDASGNPLAWEQRIVGQSIMKGTAFENFAIKDGVDSTSVEGASSLPYQIPNLQVELHSVDHPVPVQWWRSVGHSHTAFSTEVMVDELARATKQDPVEFRLKLLARHPRHLGVLKLAAEKAGWGSELPKGWGRGVAVHESFNSFVAQVAEVSVQDDGSFRVERVVCAVDCGLAINPDVIRAQMEGGIGFGLSPALVSEITLNDGQVVQSNFHDYQVLRINQMPAIEVHIVPSAEAPTGVGEPGTPPIAPAVANALSAATGQHFRRLPLKLAV
ncbi:xanthine dehydrogenase family protein molybdopterin-binding subunit [Marinobacterium sedimentorum]|uniref:xanthine dehydrogenase family protein molybdopterin-binding subunit n=1 Tax=Marinobacterium sedimentorum TaxID=2927804 RepID=UPI0020C65F85|nr:xanthine dehydrogenase family protein molybdopterin-binding subunit [Marinobacterium sedimentorum]MCP8687871.1 xanthine dehydrogenase family protein molybdopterin-binding subunit [Marinobacterium sedimentorum]